MKLAITTLVLIGAVAAANAFTYDFESPAEGTYTNLVVSAPGQSLTISRAVGFGIVDDASITRNFPESWGERALSGFVGSSPTPIRITFSNVVDSAWIEIGDFGGDQDLLTFQAFDSSNNVLGTQTFTWNGDIELDNGGVELGVVADGIKYIEVKGLSGGTNNSVYFDNLRYNEAVPEPFTMIGLAGLAAVVAAKRRKK